MVAAGSSQASLIACQVILQEYLHAFLSADFFLQN